MAKKKTLPLKKKTARVTATQKTKSKLLQKKTSKPKKKVSFIPKGYHTITSYLIVKGAAKAIEFYKKAFDAKELFRMEHKGKVAHAELKIGDSRLMLGDECPEMQAKAPSAYGGSPVSIHLYIKNADAFMKKAVSLGAKMISPVEDKFYGDRSGMLADPYGHLWCISTHIENVSPAQLKKRAKALFGE